MSVPPCVGCAKSLDAFRYQTLLHLIRCRELRLISVWHPSFLTLLLDALPTLWERLLNEVSEGNSTAVGRASPPDKKRANELRRLDPHKPETMWPRLRVLSCWGESTAALTLADLRTRFPAICIQPKGLLATEAFVTFPFADHYPLAVESHFFEFIDSQGTAIPTEGVRQGEEYEIVVTTAGGLWRYRLGDRVRVTGWLEKTPSLTFLGRTGSVSDLFGEKLSEPFVAHALAEVFSENMPRFALLAPDEDENGCRYTLYIQGEHDFSRAEALDQALRRNPHYAYCRDLEQLLPPCIFLISERGFESFAEYQAAHGARLGDIKPASLSRTAGWSKVFSGAYLHLRQNRSSELAV